MFWAPFHGWEAWLRCGANSARFELDFRVHWRYVFRGADNDALRLLTAFQAFLDQNIDRVDLPDFPAQTYNAGESRVG